MSTELGLKGDMQHAEQRYTAPITPESLNPALEEAFRTRDFISCVDKRIEWSIEAAVQHLLRVTQLSIQGLVLMKAWALRLAHGGNARMTELIMKIKERPDETCHIDALLQWYLEEKDDGSGTEWISLQLGVGTGGQVSLGSAWSPCMEHLGASQDQPETVALH